jgi:hypothetical protein
MVPALRRSEKISRDEPFSTVFNRFSASKRESSQVFRIWNIGIPARLRLSWQVLSEQSPDW